MDEAQRRKSLARWHRRLAVVVGLWLAVLALSGVLVNHAHDWGLDARGLPAVAQRLVYGIEPDDGEFFARLTLPAGELLLGATRLLLLGSQGEVIESLPVSQLGLDELRAGLHLGGQVFLRDAQRTVRTDPELLDWQTLDAPAAESLSGAAWQLRDEGPGAITWERALLDLHAARFLGPAAKYLNDLVGGLLLLLVFSGAWLSRYRRARG